MLRFRISLSFRIMDAIVFPNPLIGVTRTLAGFVRTPGRMVVCGKSATKTRSNSDRCGRGYFQLMTTFSDELRLITKHLKPGVGGRGRRSSLFHWMSARADAFQRVLDDTQPSWDSVASALAAQDLKDGSGKPPTGERARKTWFEVRRAKGWHLMPLQQSQQAAPAPRPPAPLIPLPHPEPSADDSPTPADARARLLARMKPVTIPKKEQTNG